MLEGHRGHAGKTLAQTPNQLACAPTTPPQTPAMWESRCDLRGAITPASPNEDTLLTNSVRPEDRFLPKWVDLQFL